MLITKLFGAKSTDSLKKLVDKTPLFAKQSNFVTRVSKTFDPKLFVASLLKLVGEGASSFHSIATSLDELTHCSSCSYQAISERLNRKPEEAIAFMKSCVAEALRSTKPIGATQEFKGFKRILIGDSSTITLPKVLAKLFPATGNTHGRTAGVKFNLTYDILNYEVLEADLIEKATDDKIIGVSLIKHVKEGDLVIRDMGYYKRLLFECLREAGAHWLSRLPAFVKYVEIVGGKEDGEMLEDHLKQTQKDRIDCQVRLREWSEPVRLVAVRAAKEVTSERKRELRETAKKNGKIASKAALIRAEWHIMITSVDTEKLSIDQLCELYGQRWNIEIAFRAWKQSMNLGTLFTRKTSRAHVMIFLLAGVIRCLLTLRSYSYLLQKPKLGSKRLSLQLLASTISSSLIALYQGKGLPNIKVRNLKTQSRASESRPNLQSYNLQPI